MKARKNIWDLISILRKGRAVALATHYLDEAEHLSDSILIMNEVSLKLHATFWAENLISNVCLLLS